MVNWDDNELRRFFEAVYQNQKVNITKFGAPYQTVTRINACLSKAGKQLTNPKPLFAGILFMRAKYAYMAAAGMALSGQVVEYFSMLRMCLECAGYALLIYDEPKLETVFMSRHKSEADKKIQKKQFLMGSVTKIIRKYDPKLADNFQTFYDRAVDFGAHPNQHAIFGAMTVKRSDQNIEVGQLALHDDPKTILHALKTTAQVGLTVLFIFQHIFKAKFALLGIHAEMNKLRNAGL